MKKIIYFIMFSILFVSCDKAKNNLRDGNKAFDAKRYSEAENLYRKALAIDTSYDKARYNLANTSYMQNKKDSYKKAIMYYDKALSLDSIKDTNFQASVLYNRANSNFKLALLDSSTKSNDYSQCLKNAINDYKLSLKLSPKDSSAKYNLTLAMHLLKQNSNKNKTKNQDKQNQQNHSQNDNKKDNKEKQDNSSVQVKIQNKEEGDRMLEALKNNERNTLEKIKKEKDKNIRQVRTDKDW